MEERVVDVGLPRNVVFGDGVVVVLMTSTRVPCSVREHSHDDCSTFLAQFHSGMPCNWLWKKPLGGITARTQFDKKKMETLNVVVQDVSAQASRLLIDLEEETRGFPKMFARGKSITLWKSQRHV